MNQRLYQLLSFLNYWLDAVDAHSIHSPFFFDFYKRHISPSKHTRGIELLESLRSVLLHDKTEIDIQDLGAGSRHFDSPKRRLDHIARVSLSPVKYSMLYRGIIEYTKARRIVELGTSLGINTLYLSHAIDCHVYTFEGSPHIADVASKQFEIARANNITIVRGNIDATLPTLLSAIETVDFALVDANHKFKPTLDYFELLKAKAHGGTVIVFDDIHYSEEMTKAWRQIVKSNEVYGSVDLFRCGLVFFDPSLNRQHFVLQF